MALDLPQARPRRRLTRSLILILIVLALLQLLAGGVPLLVISYTSQQNIIEEAQRQAGEKTALAITNYLEGAIIRLEQFVQDHDPAILLQGQESLELPRMVDTLLEKRDYLEIWILDPAGQEVFQRSYRRFVHPDRYGSRADQPAYQAIASGDSRYIGPIYIPDDPALAQFSVATIAIPIPASGDTPGALIAELNAHQIQRIISETPLGERAYAYVVDRDGVLRVHWADPRVALEQRDISGVLSVQAFLNAQDATQRYEGINPAIEGSVLGTWVPIESTDWGLIVEQPLSEAFSGLYRITIWLAGVLAISVLAASGVGWLLARRLLRPLGTLQEGALQLAQGNLGHRIELRSENEFGVLATTFNLMAERVQSSHEAIEAEVQARTQELSRAYERLQRQSEEQLRLLETIRKMSTPVIPVLEGVVVMPLVGSLDTERASMVTEALLAGIERHRARVTILDITGVPIVDTAVANALLQAMRSATLLGVQPVLVGITPEVAHTVVHLGVDLSQIVTRSTLQAGIEYAMRQLGRRA